MKSLVFIAFSLALVIYGIMAEAEHSPRFETERQRAIEIMTIALSNPALRAREKEQLPKAISKLSSDQIRILSEEDLNKWPSLRARCDIRTYAFVPFDDRNTIWICPRGIADSKLVNSNQELDFFAQTLIHESVHSAGWMAECSAAETEIRTMALAKIRLVYWSQYGPECNLEYLEK